MTLARCPVRVRASPDAGNDNLSSKDRVYLSRKLAPKERQLEFPLPQEFPPLEERRGRGSPSHFEFLFNDFEGRFWGLSLEGCWKPLGPSWAEKGGQRGYKLAPKTEPKSIKTRSKNRSISLYLLESSFFGFSLIFEAKNRTMLA